LLEAAIVGAGVVISSHYEVMLAVDGAPSTTGQHQHISIISSLISHVLKSVLTDIETISAKRRPMIPMFRRLMPAIRKVKLHVEILSARDRLVAHYLTRLLNTRRTLGLTVLVVQAIEGLLRRR
jgi:hypothetical protein